MNTRAGSRKKFSKDESGVALVFSAVIVLAIMSLVGLAVSVLWLMASNQQVGQYAEIFAEAALRRYIETRDDPAFGTTVFPTIAAGENARRQQACAFGRNASLATIGTRLINVPFNNVNNIQATCQFGWWWMPGTQPPGNPALADTIQDCNIGSPFGRDCNSAFVQVRQNVYAGIFTRLFAVIGGAAVPDNTAIMVRAEALHDERLTARGIYPHLVRIRYVPLLGNSANPQYN